MKIRSLIIIILIFFMSFGGCSKQQEQQGDQQQAKEEIPKELEKISTNLEETIKLLGGPAAQTRDEMEQQKKEQSQQQDNKSSQEDSDQNTAKNQTDNKDSSEKSQKDETDSDKKDENSDEKKQQGDQEGEQQGNQEKSQQDDQQEPKKEEDKKTNAESQNEEDKKESEENAFASFPALNDNDWLNIGDIIETLHFSWNSYEPMLQEKNLDLQTMQSFDSCLTELTNAVESKNRSYSLTYASELYTFIPAFYSLYSSKIPPEVIQVKSDTINAMIYSMQGKWEEAQVYISRLESTWSVFRGSINEKQSQERDMLHFSINDLKTAVQSKDTLLVKIKGKINLSNVLSLEKSITQE